MSEAAADAGIDGGGPFSFRPRPMVVEAIRWTGKNCTEIAEWAGDLVHIEQMRSPGGRSVLVLLLYRGRGVETIPIGHWIMRDPAGALHSYDPHTFDVIYMRSDLDDDHCDATAGNR
ncbi:hypothetical protein OG563_46715 [Nocardia vinacea]|uniref:Uncharacterized protein n=1 Tax=Nocardia vinacea TaxID=96468 RepID=A0ABZ1YT54_9NOCA|nr:hypothetical protein [Nocardia vinacea]